MTSRPWLEKKRGKWHVRWREADGTRPRSAPYPTKAAAVRARDAMTTRLADEGLGIDAVRPNPEGWTIGELSTWALERLDKRDSSRGHFRAWTRSALADVQLDRVRVFDIERALDVFDREVGPATVNRRRTALMASFTKAKKLGYWRGANPVRETDARDERAAAAVRKHTDLETIWALIDECDPNYAGVVALAGLHGLRKGEIAALAAGDLDFDRSLINVARSYSRGATKGKRRDIVQMHAEVVSILEEAVARVPNGPLWPTRTGQPLRPGDHTYDKVMREACAAVGCEPITLHGLRHTFGTILDASGVSAGSLQSHLRHESITTTMRYVHAAQIARQGGELEALRRPTHAPNTPPPKRKAPADDD